MNTKTVFILVIATFGTNVLSLECPSCRGSECLQSQTVFDKCSQKIAALPFGYESKLSINNGAKKLGCISLEYEIEMEIQYSVKQCYLIPEDNLCESISSSLPSSIVMKNCEFYFEDRVQNSVSRLFKREAQNDDTTELDGSGDYQESSTTTETRPPESTTNAGESTTERPTTGNPVTTPNPTDSPSTTPQDSGVAGIAGSIFVLLLTCILQTLV